MSDLPPPPGLPSERQTQAQVNTMAIVALVLSLVGLILFGIILGIVAVVLGAISYQQINKEPGRYRGGGLAIAAMIIGALDVVLALVVISAIT